MSALINWHEYLIQELGDLVRDFPPAVTWLAGLMDGNESQILGLCLAIDLASGSLAPSTVAEVLKNIDAPSGEACHDFVTAIARHGDCRFCSRQKSRPGPDDFYVRVMGLYEFFAYSYKDASGASWSEEDINELRSELKSPSGRPLGDVDKGFSGAGGTNWICDCREIEEEIGPRGSFGIGAGTALADCLGLPEKKSFAAGNPPEIILVTYPPFVDLDLWKPTTLDGFWVGGFFLSSNRTDGWGLTQSCSGSASAKKERIHKAFSSLKNDFLGWYVGPMGDIVSDRDALHAKGAERWHDWTLRGGTTVDRGEKC